MALTQHAIHPTPSWDESIVPALRQRLQGESRLLSKRISNLSTSSVEEQPVASGSSSSQPFRTTETRSAAVSIAPTSRPSLGNYGRPSTEQQNHPPLKSSGRSRTLSQPPAFHKSTPSAHSVNFRPSAGSSTDSRPTRIPKAARSPQLGFSRSPPMPFHSTAADLWEPPNHANPSLPSIHTPSNKYSDGLLNDEQPPFQAGSFTSTGESFDPPRPSMESDEKPFEHWYRGESSRNGGVGELRVGNQKEMLEIAHFGHSIRGKSRRAQGNGHRDALTDTINTEAKRRRADSVGPRGSFYLDEKGGNSPRVIDEAPLTDLEMDDEGYGDEYLDDQPSRSATPTASLSFHQPPPVVTPSKPVMLSPSENLPNPTASSKLSATSTKPARATSPNMRPSPTSPAPKRVGGKTSPSMTPMREKQLQREKEREKQRAKEKALKERRSVAKYTIEGDDGGDMTHAIPSWTQPVHGSGNWDEVVLPAVARKKGLDVDGSYEKADGSAKEQAPPPIEPAPGTFAFDHAKYRSPREGDSIPMDEFRPYPPLEQEPTSSEPLQTPLQAKRKSQPPKPLQPSTPSTPMRSSTQPPPSPAPFSHYAPTSTKVIEAQPPLHSPPQPEPEEESPSGGCCKCVIM